MRQYRSVIKTNKFPQLTRRVFTTADGLKSDNVTAMRFDNNGVLFVGTDKGLATVKNSHPFQSGQKTQPSQ